jgi:pyridoxine/pyridoxamine 5'-phosphate oxidase
MPEQLRWRRRLSSLWRHPSGTAPTYQGSLRHDDLDADPIEQFARWFAAAGESVPLAEAMAPSTPAERQQSATSC